MGLPIPIEQIQQSILLIRGKRVMLDSDLAKLYGVSNKRLKEIGIVFPKISCFN